MIKIGKIIFLSLLFSMAAEGSVTVQANVDSPEATVEEPVTLTISILSDRSVDIEAPHLADLNGFRLDNAWDSTSVSQRMMSTDSGMEWQTQRRKDFNYNLTPMKIGRLTIPAIEVKVDGQVYSTKPILITVSEAGAPGGRPKPQRRQWPPGFNVPAPDTLDDIERLEEEMFNQLLNQRMGRGGPPLGGGGGGLRPQRPEPEYRTLPTNPNEAFFVQVEVDKREVYEGEQITVSWYIYTRGQPESLDRVKFPDLKGFWKEVIEEVPMIQFTEEVVNGVPYRKALLASHALFPIKAGDSVIDEYRIKSRVRMPVQNNYGFGLGRAQEFTSASQKVNIKVKPLPPEGKPDDFAGAVGQFEVQTSIEGQKFPAHQPFSLRVRFEGLGNAKMIDLPQIQWPQGVEIYDIKSESKFFKDGRSYIQFDLLMIPRQTGPLSIPEVSFSLFDPVGKKYYQKKTSAIDLEISEGIGPAPGGEEKGHAGAAAKAATPQLPAPILQLESSMSGVWAYQKFLLWGIYLLSFLGLFLKARHELGWGQKKRSLKDLIEKRFKKVEGALKTQDHRKVGAELLNIFYFLLGEATGQSGAVQEFDRLLDKVPPSVRRELGDSLKKSLELYQVLGFAPQEMLGPYIQAENLKKVVTDARDLSQKLLKALMAQTTEEPS